MPTRSHRSRADAPVRMEDVARAAGVSPITVSRALNMPEKLSPATLAAVQGAIDRLRYVRNLAAGTLASDRSRIVAAIVPTIASSIFSDTVEGLSTALSAQRYQLLLGQTGYRDDEEARLIDAFLGRRVDGLVLVGVQHARGVRAKLQRAGIPVVETWDLNARPIDMLVGFSNRAAGEAAAAYLAGRGYRRLGFIGGDDERSATRLESFRTAARAAGAGEVLIALERSPSSVLDGGRAMGALLDAANPPRAVFCTNDMLAAGALFECQRRRIAVPGAVAVMGFADLPIAAGTEPALTTVQVRADEMGRRAGAMLLQRLAGAAVPQRIVDLGFTVVQRASA
jgi:LacI family gluconate utilization system Gnt-I transcriptional repressor